MATIHDLRLAFGKMEMEFADDLRAISAKYIGKGGQLETILKQLGELPPDHRRELGDRANEFCARVKHMVRQ